MDETKKMYPASIPKSTDLVRVSKYQVDKKPTESSFDGLARIQENVGRPNRSFDNQANTIKIEILPQSWQYQEQRSYTRNQDGTTAYTQQQQFRQDNGSQAYSSKSVQSGPQSTTSSSSFAYAQPNQHFNEGRSCFNESASSFVEPKPYVTQSSSRAVEPEPRLIRSNTTYDSDEQWKLIMVISKICLGLFVVQCLISAIGSVVLAIANLSNQFFAIPVMGFLFTATITAVAILFLLKQFNRKLFDKLISYEHFKKVGRLITKG